MLKLVYACLAFTVIALVILVATAFSEKSFFRGTTSEMLRALQDPGLVLAADEHGAVTQTGNGIVAGHRRSGESAAWTMRFDRFPDTRGWRNWSSVLDNASAWCAGRCPAAFVAIGGNYSARGGASAELAAELNRDHARILAAPAPDSVFANRNNRLVHYKGGTSTDLPVTGPSVVEVDGSARRLIVGSADGTTGTLQQFERSGRSWREAAEPLRLTALGNICISRDGRGIATIARRTAIGSFGSDELRAVARPVSAGRCSFDGDGVTFVFNATSGPRHILARRHSTDGRLKWRADYGGHRLISPTGSPLIVDRSANGTLTAHDARSGAKLTLNPDSALFPFVSSDGSILYAERSGRPVWVDTER